NLKEVKQFIEILFHTGHGSRISLLPARGEVPVSLSRLAVIGSVADTVQGFLNRWLIVLFHFVQNVSCLMSPTALEQDLGVDDLRLRADPFLHRSPSARNNSPQGPFDTDPLRKLPSKLQIRSGRHRNRSSRAFRQP